MFILLSIVDEGGGPPRDHPCRAGREPWQRVILSILSIVDEGGGSLRNYLCRVFTTKSRLKVSMGG